MSFGNAFLAGLNSGRRNKLQRAEEARTQTDFENRQAGLEALKAVDGVGDLAYVPTEYGQITGVNQRRELFPGELEQQGIRTETMQENLSSDQEARARQSAIIGNRYMDMVTRRAVADGRDPQEALFEFGASLTPEARQLMGLDEGSIGNWIDEVRDNPNFFKERAEALMDPVRPTGSTAAPKFGTGEVTLADGKKVRGEIVKNADGTVTLVGQPDAQVAAFEPDAPFSPKDFGTSNIYTFGASGQDPQAGPYIGGGVQDREVRERMGYKQGDFLGQRWSEDQTLSETASNDAVQMMERDILRGQNTIYSIDQAISQASWESVGPNTVWSDIPASEANVMRGFLTTVTSNAIIDQLKDIKASGATLGQITEKELEVLANSVAVLKQDLPPHILKKELERYRANLDRTLSRARDNIRRDIERGRLSPSDDIVRRNFPDLAEGGTRSEADILSEYGIE